jgi:methylmalonyl-CoA decarboxylase subunit alpha
MGNTSDNIQILKQKEQEILKMGGEAALEKRKSQGRLNARERLDCLFDPGSFRELDMFVTHRCTNFGMEKVAIPADGVVTGHGKVDGRVVFAYAQDFTARAGSLGEMQAKKICKIMDMALKAGAPVIGMNDSGGARIQEGIDALSGYGEIFFRNSACSGVIPRFPPSWAPLPAGRFILRP